MKIETKIKYTLSEEELRKIIRNHFIDRLGTSTNIDESDINLNGYCNENYEISDFSASITIKKVNETE